MVFQFNLKIYKQKFKMRMLVIDENLEHLPYSSMALETESYHMTSPLGVI